MVESVHLLWALWLARRLFPFTLLSCQYLKGFKDGISNLPCLLKLYESRSQLMEDWKLSRHDKLVIVCSVAFAKQISTVRAGPNPAATIKWIPSEHYVQQLYT